MTGQRAAVVTGGGSGMGRAIALRLAQELVVDSTIEFAMQDVNTIEATHSALATRAQRQFQLSDQELLIRQFHTVIRDTVAAYESEVTR